MNNPSAKIGFADRNGVAQYSVLSTSTSVLTSMLGINFDQFRAKRTQSNSTTCVYLLLGSTFPFGTTFTFGTTLYPNTTYSFRTVSCANHTFLALQTTLFTSSLESYISFILSLLMNLRWYRIFAVHYLPISFIFLSALVWNISN